ncbi:unnamed protein product [Callosobruchus maculatus]|uniref:Uncharacterized protein n=1 Tax=Callosobruchus maculatus TaxID=64391 RepID=A0A653D6F9_CALMS|nr:unnamed protein product [Callosobruchus maculatus]
MPPLFQVITITRFIFLAKHEDENRSLQGVVSGIKKAIRPWIVVPRKQLVKISELERILPHDVVEQLLRKTAKHEDENRSLGGFVKKVWSVAKNVGPKVAKGAWKLIKNSAFRSSGGLKDTTYELERILPDDVVEQLLRKTAKHEDENRSLGGFVKKVWSVAKNVGPKVAKGAWKLIKNSAFRSSGGLKDTTYELERILPDDVVEQLLRKTDTQQEGESRSLQEVED